MSWDVVLLRFREGGAVTVDVDEAKLIVLAADGVRLTEPGVAEITNDGVADIHFGGQSPEIYVFRLCGFSGRDATHPPRSARVANGRVLPHY